MPIKARPVSVARAAAFAQGHFEFANDDRKESVTKNESVSVKENLCVKQDSIRTKGKTEFIKINHSFAHDGDDDDSDTDTVSSSSSTSSAANINEQSNTKEKRLSHITNCKEEVENDKFASSLQYRHENDKQVHLHTFLTEQANIVQEDEFAALTDAMITGTNVHEHNNTSLNRECENKELDIKTSVNTKIVSADVCREETNNAMPCRNTLEESEQQSEYERESSYTKYVPEEKRGSSEEENVMQSEDNKSVGESEFDRLMSLLAIDVTRERQERESLLPHSPSMLQKEQQQQQSHDRNGNTNTTEHISNTKNDVNRITHDNSIKYSDNGKSSTIHNDSSNVSDVDLCDEGTNQKTEKLCKNDVLQIHANINAALESLYNTWENNMCDMVEGSNPYSRPFIATEHYGEAYLMLNDAQAINNDNKKGSANSLSFYTQTENKCTRQKFTLPNKRNDCEFNEQLMHSNKWWDKCSSTSSNNVANEAQDRLDRFLLSVHLIERVVHDAVFIRLVANYLHSHRHVFIHHHHYYHQHCHVRSAKSDNYGKSESKNESDDYDNNMHKIHDGSSTEEHSHDEYAIFNMFSETVSNMLISVLTTHVANFDESEFVEELYSTPLIFVSSFEDNMSNNNPTSTSKATSLSHAELHDNNNNNNNNNNRDTNKNNNIIISNESGAHNATCAINVLSYPAWRVIMAMSDFNSFFDWVMDFLIEEFSLAMCENDSNVIVGGGHGIRALLNSTYTKRKTEQGKTNDIWAKQEALQPMHDEETEQQSLELHKRDGEQEIENYEENYQLYEEEPKLKELETERKKTMREEEQQIIHVDLNDWTNRNITNNTITLKDWENYKTEKKNFTEQTRKSTSDDNNKYQESMFEFNMSILSNTKKPVLDANTRQTSSCSSSILFSTNMPPVNNLSSSSIASKSSSVTSVAPPAPISATSQTSLRLRQLVRSKQQESSHKKQENMPTQQLREHQRRHCRLPPLREEATECSFLPEYSATAPVRSNSKTKNNEPNTGIDIIISSSSNSGNINTQKRTNNVKGTVSSNNVINGHAKDSNNKNEAVVNIKSGKHTTSNLYKREAAFNSNLLESKEELQL